MQLLINYYSYLCFHTSKSNINRYFTSSIKLSCGVVLCKINSVQAKNHVAQLSSALKHLTPS